MNNARATIELWTVGRGVGLYATQEKCVEVDFQVYSWSENENYIKNQFTTL